MKQNTRHATHETQVQREAEKKTYAHDKDSYYGNRHTDKECARGRPRSIIGKVPRFACFCCGYKTRKSLLRLLLWARS